jgi:hypothetical protein
MARKSLSVGETDWNTLARRGSCKRARDLVSDAHLESCRHAAVRKGTADGDSSLRGSKCATGEEGCQGEEGEDLEEGRHCKDREKE